MKLLQVELTKEHWARLDEIDGTTIVEGAELESWQLGCAYQAETHPDEKIRAMFERATSMDNLTRKDCRALASLAVFPKASEHCNDL